MSTEPQTYYLVSPVNNNLAHSRHFFWMLDTSENKWIGIARGIWREKHERDIVKETAKAEHLTLLDWKKTPFYDDKSRAGWLSRDGRFYGCPEVLHDTLAYCLFGVKVGELEKTGWVRVKNSYLYTCEQRLTPEQSNWLSGQGYKVIEVY
ncbi:MAG: hypothetical protein HY886_09190 [Deltaproteobacteria bacterium]|nr:hypothetical protein [Deltaproteobacteria bacterium]